MKNGELNLYIAVIYSMLKSWVYYWILLLSFSALFFSTKLVMKYFTLKVSNLIIGKEEN